MEQKNEMEKTGIEWNYNDVVVMLSLRPGEISEDRTKTISDLCNELQRVREIAYPDIWNNTRDPDFVSSTIIVLMRAEIEKLKAVINARGI